MSGEPGVPQLQMAFNSKLIGSPIKKQTTPPEYRLRMFHSGDEDGWFQLMGTAGFEGWDQEKLAPWLERILPGGWFVAVHEESKDIVATAMAVHGPTGYFPFGGELGWVAGDPNHSGRNLGAAVCGAVTSRLLDMGYTNIHLNTDDFRLPAIRIYLKLGYVPLLFAPQMRERWEALCHRLDWPFQPDEWMTV